MNNNSRRLTDSERLVVEKEIINSLIKEDVFHATLTIKRAHLSLLQETFPESSIVPAFPCLEVVNPSAPINIIPIKISNNGLVLSIPLGLCSAPSLEEYFADEDTSDEEIALLQHGQKILADFSKASCKEDDEIVVSFYPRKN